MALIVCHAEPLAAVTPFADRAAAGRYSWQKVIDCSLRIVMRQPSRDFSDTRPVSFSSFFAICFASAAPDVTLLHF